MPTFSPDFDAQETLANPQDIVDFGPVDPNSYSEQRLPFIALREEKFFAKCMGMPMYAALIADKVKYSMVSGTGIVVYTNYKEGVANAIGDVVLYKNRLYKAKAITNGTQAPTNESYWKLAPRFVTDANNYIWDRYLRVIIAFMVNSDSLFYRIVSDTAQGLVQKTSETAKPIKPVDAARVKQEYQVDIDDLMQTMDVFLHSHKVNFPNYLPFLSSCDNCAPRRRRNYGFNVYK